MANLDIKKNAESIAELFVSFFEQYVQLLTKPKTAIAHIFSSEITSRKRFQTALVFSIISILIGIAFARFVGLPDSPAEVNPETAIAVLLVWILSAVLLHPLLKLFKAKGALQDTIVVFLLVISSLHLIFIPVLSVASHLLTDTKVTLTYNYVVYFGANIGNKGLDRSYYSEEIKRMLETSVDWRTKLEGKHTEAFIKEKEPERNQSILPPAPELNELKSFSEVPMNPEIIKRIGTKDGLYERPKRTEQPVLSSSGSLILLVIWISYYLINSCYLAIGLSVPHRKSPYFFFSMAIIGPILSLFVFIFVVILASCVKI